MTTHAKEIRVIVTHYAEIAGLRVNHDHLNSAEFARRLIHAAAKELGLVIELIVAAIEDTLTRAAGELDRNAFARAFARRSGCSHVGNPKRTFWCPGDPQFRLYESSWTSMNGGVSESAGVAIVQHPFLTASDSWRTNLRH